MLTTIDVPIQTLIPFIKLVVFFISFTAHEVAHGYAALACGDTTAKIKGRLSLSPLKHIDVIGSVIMPIMLFLMRSETIIGWGKTVPVDFKKFTRGQHLFVSAAGVLANFFLVIAGIGFFFMTKNMMIEGSSIWIQIFCVAGFMFVPINIILALLNILPLCPFDGWVFFKGFSEERKDLQEKKVNPYLLVFNIALAFIILKVAGPVIIYGIKLITYG